MSEKRTKLSLMGFEKSGNESLMVELEIAPVSLSFFNELLKEPPGKQVEGSWELDHGQIEKLLSLLRAYLTSGKCDFFVEERDFNEKRFGDAHTAMLNVRPEES